jgi:hypothetical protein
MRFWLSAVTLLVLGACAAPEYAPVVYANSGWRSMSGSQLSLGEVEALKETCRPRAISLPLDSADLVANPVRDNAIYHPGGQGWGNAPSTGIAAADRPLELGFRRTAYTVGAIEECLIEKGLVRVERPQTATLR